MPTLYWASLLGTFLWTPGHHHLLVMDLLRGLLKLHLHFLSLDTVDSAFPCQVSSSWSFQDPRLSCCVFSDWFFSVFPCSPYPFPTPLLMYAVNLYCRQADSMTSMRLSSLVSSHCLVLSSFTPHLAPPWRASISPADLCSSFPLSRPFLFPTILLWSQLRCHFEKSLLTPSLVRCFLGSVLSSAPRILSSILEPFTLGGA
jgi:hypothetical protein